MPDSIDREEENMETYDDRSQRVEVITPRVTLDGPMDIQGNLEPESKRRGGPCSGVSEQQDASAESHGVRPT